MKPKVIVVNIHIWFVQGSDNDIRCFEQLFLNKWIDYNIY